MTVEYSKRAVSDLRQIAAYHAHSNTVAVGEKVAAALRALVISIGQEPLLGRPVAPRPGVRVRLLMRYRYKIFYRVGTTVRIIHIRHTSRRPWPPA